MAKAKKAKQSTQLPLDDMLRWRPIAEIAERLFPIIGNKSLIAQDLTEMLATEKIPCRRRHTNEAHEVGHHQPAGRELLPASFWTEHYLACPPIGDINVVPRVPPNDHGPFVICIASGVFYLWQPDC